MTVGPCASEPATGLQDRSSCTCATCVPRAVWSPCQELCRIGSIQHLSTLAAQLCTSPRAAVHPARGGSKFSGKAGRAQGQVVQKLNGATTKLDTAGSLPVSGCFRRVRRIYHGSRPGGVRNPGWSAPVHHPRRCRCRSRDVAGRSVTPQSAAWGSPASSCQCGSRPPVLPSREAGDDQVEDTRSQSIAREPDRSQLSQARRGTDHWESPSLSVAEGAGKKARGAARLRPPLDRPVEGLMTWVVGDARAEARSALTAPCRTRRRLWPAPFADLPTRAASMETRCAGARCSAAHGAFPPPKADPRAPGGPR